MKCIFCAVMVTVAVAASQVSLYGEEKLGSGNASGGEMSLREKLNKRIDLNVVEAALKDVIELLHQNTDIQFVLQIKKLEEASVSPDTPVTKNLKQVRLSTLLELLLKDLELTYMEKDGLLLITTPEDAESRLQIRLYDCRDLLAMPAPQVPASPSDRRPAQPMQPQAAEDGAPAGTRQLAGTTISDGTRRRRVPETELERRTDQLTDLITSSVRPDSWDDVGGPGSIVSYNGLYVVAQTTHVQEQVEQLFNLLREAAGLEVRAGKAVRD